jgi:uncharacterized protein (TIGR03437 family)
MLPRDCGRSHVLPVTVRLLQTCTSCPSNDKIVGFGRKGLGVIRFTRAAEFSRRTFLRTAVAASAGNSLIPCRLNADSAPFARYPNIQNVNAAGATIVWALSSQAAGSVRVVDPSGNAVTVPATVTEFDPSQTGMAQSYYQYEAAIGNLAPGKTYSYQIQADGQVVPCSLSNPLQFRTAGNGPFNFLHFADSGEGNDQQIQLSQQMAQENVALVLANGDLAYDLATFSSVEANYYGIYRAMMTQTPFFGGMGNHEYYTNSGGPSLAGRVTPASGVCSADQGRYYSFDWANVHFVVLDSNQPLVDAISGAGQMLTWLDSDLQATRKFWRVVLFHHPGYATGVHQDEPPAGQVRQYIVPILEKYGVQLVFNGHEHTYQRTYELLGGQVVTPNSGGIVYITSGGGGATPYWTAPNDLIAQSIGVNNYVRGEVADSSILVVARALGSSADMDTAVLAPLPQLSSALNTASLSTDLASGGLMSIFGRNLCPTEVHWSPQKPRKLAAGCVVTINGTPIPLFYCDAAQMNVQIPFSVDGPAVVTVVTSNGTAQAIITVAAVAPQLFVNPDGSAVAAHADGSSVKASAPASPNETITLFLTGLGAVNPPAVAGSVSSGGSQAVANIKVTLGGTPVNAGPATLSASVPGVYQIPIQVPGGLTLGPVALEVTANGVASNQPFLPLS